jgi:hypothetical protein
LKTCTAYRERGQTDNGTSRVATLGDATLGSLPKAGRLEEEPIADETVRDDQVVSARRPRPERDLREVLRDTEAYLRRAVAEQQARQRRDLIQSVKEETLYRSWQYRTMSAEVKAEALQEVERKLLALPIHELSRREVVQIAEGIRDRFLRSAVDVPRAPGTRPGVEEEAHRQAKHEKNRLEIKRRLIEHGMSSADRELRLERDLTPAERRDIREFVHNELEEDLDGEESKDEVEALVNDILDELISGDDEEEVNEFGGDEENDSNN